MNMLNRDEAHKRFRYHIQTSLSREDELPATAYIPWRQRPIPIPMNGINDPNATQLYKVTLLFQAGFMMATAPAKDTTIDYFLFGSVMWLVRRPEGGMVGALRDQPDRKEVVQILESTPDGITRAVFYPVEHEGDQVSLGEPWGVPSEMTTPLMSAFWAGVEVGKVQGEVRATARGEEPPPTDEGGKDAIL